MPVECVKFIPIRGFMGQNNKTTIIKVTSAIFCGVNSCIQRRTNRRLCSAKNINCQMNSPAIRRQPWPVSKSRLCVNQTWFKIIPQPYIAIIFEFLAKARGFIRPKVERIFWPYRVFNRERSQGRVVQVLANDGRKTTT